MHLEGFVWASSLVFLGSGNSEIASVFLFLIFRGIGPGHGKFQSVLMLGSFPVSPRNKKADGC